VQLDFSNANDDTNTQLQQAEMDLLTRGDCILIVAPHDSAAGASIVTKDRQQQVPVIAYDRFIFSEVSTMLPKA
jgi:D-xylose transport system substrate-binding protein